MKYVLLAWSLSFFIGSCNTNSGTVTEVKSDEQNKLSRFEWLRGTWESQTGNGSFFEIWTKASDTSLTGNGFMIAENDTLFSEHITLEVRGDDIFYIPVVTGQNNGKKILFKLISSADNEFVFENKEHDFPQKIIYNHSSPDSLYARVEGFAEGKLRQEEFIMSRKN